MSPRLFSFVGGAAGTWKVRSQHAFIGPALPVVPFVDVIGGSAGTPDAGWCLRGVTSNGRYVVRGETEDLVSRQAGLGRPEATCAALLPIRKSSAWWALAQDERRMIFEEQSRHIRLGLKYLPPIARRLHHCRDLAETEPFDFLTWFEYAPDHEDAFEKLLRELRASREWAFVEREVDIRLGKVAA